MRSDITAEMYLDKGRHAIRYYEELDGAVSFADYSVSHNRDERIEQLFLQLEPSKLIESACKYPFHLYANFKEKVRELYHVNNFVVGSGSEDLIFRLNQYFLQQLTTGVVMPNFYRIYETIGDVRYFFTSSEGLLDIAALEQWIRANDIAAVWISNPNPIYWVVYQHDKLLYLINQYPQLLFIVDEANIEFSEEKTELELIEYTQKFSNLVVIRSFSKFFSLPGIRVGLLITENQQILNHFTQSSQVFPLSGPGVIFALHAIENYDFFKSLAREIHSKKTGLLELLQRNKLLTVAPSTSNTLFVYSETINIWEWLVQRGFLTLDLSKEMGIQEKHAIRLTVHSSATMFANLYAILQELDLS